MSPSIQNRRGFRAVTFSLILALFIFTDSSAFAGEVKFSLRVRLTRNQTVIGVGEGLSRKAFEKRAMYRSIIQSYTLMNGTLAAQSCEVTDSMLEGLPHLLYNLGGEVEVQESYQRQPIPSHNSSGIIIKYKTHNGEECKINHSGYFDSGFLVSNLLVNNDVQEINRDEILLTRVKHFPLDEDSVTGYFSSSVTLFWVPAATLFKKQGLSVYKAYQDRNNVKRYLFWEPGKGIRGMELAVDLRPDDAEVSCEYWVKNRDVVLNIQYFKIKTDEKPDADTAGQLWGNTETQLNLTIDEGSSKTLGNQPSGSSGTARSSSRFQQPDMLAMIYKFASAVVCRWAAADCGKASGTYQTICGVFLSGMYHFWQLASKSR